MSGTAYFFAKKLQKELGIPVGVIRGEVLWIIVHILEPVPAYAAFALQQLKAEVLVEPASFGLGVYIPSRASGIG